MGESNERIMRRRELELLEEQESRDLIPRPGEQRDLPDGEEGGVSQTRQDPQQSEQERRRQQSVERGTPLSTDIAFRNQQIREGGSARINALIDMFGDDSFIIQHLLFRIPPLSIRITKQNINYKWKSLRTRDVTVVPSGHGECYINVPLVFVGEAQLKRELADLIKVFKICPFAFIENKYIRDMIMPDAPEDSMAACLETLHMSAASGAPDTVNVNLSMKWFNYKPYSNHFWFRRDWAPLTGNRAAEDQENTGRTTASGVTDTIVDMSQIETPENLDVSLPPEVRLPSVEQQGETNDPTIARTEPVVYPFNSRAFLNYIENFTTINGQSFSFRNWNDALSMRWNSYRRIPWPTNTFDIQSEGTPSETIDSQPSRRDRFAEPPPVDSSRDVILFVGDSITVGYYLAGADDNNSTPQLREVNDSARDVFTQHDGFDFYAIAKVGANSNSLRAALNSALDDSTFADRVAGVIIACGANDGAGTSGSLDTVGNINLMCRKVTEALAIAVVLPIWPINDPIEGDPDFGKSVDFPIAAKATISLRNEGLRTLDLTLGPKVVFRNTHVEEITTQPNSWGGLWPSSFRQISGNSINVHPNFRTGYPTIANVVNDLLPWRAFSGERIERVPEQAVVYGIVNILDGDTVILTGPEGEITVRMLYIDAPETAQAPYGEEAKNALANLLDDEVTLQYGRTREDRYGRVLAEVINTSDGLNVNKKMVELGLVAINEQYVSSTEQSDYYTLLTAARTANLGIWSTPGLQQTPWEYRRQENIRPEI